MFLDIEEIRDKDNATGLKRGRRNRNVNLQVLFHIRDAHALLRLKYLPSAIAASGSDLIFKHLALSLTSQSLTQYCTTKSVGAGNNMGHASANSCFSSLASSTAISTDPSKSSFTTSHANFKVLSLPSAVLPVKNKNSDARSSVVEIQQRKNKMLVYAVWVSFEGMVTEKTLKEKSTVKK